MYKSYLFVVRTGFSASIIALFTTISSYNEYSIGNTSFIATVLMLTALVLLLFKASRLSASSGEKKRRTPPHRPGGTKQPKDVVPFESPATIVYKKDKAA